MDEIYGTEEGKRKPIASETQYYEKMRNERKEEFAPVYNEYEKPQSSNESDYRQQPQQQNYGFQSQSYSNEYGGNKYQDANQQGDKILKNFRKMYSIFFIQKLLHFLEKLLYQLFRKKQYCYKFLKFIR